MQVKNACLADILGLGTGLADLGLFEAGVGARLPSEDSEGARADFAFRPERSLRHANVGIISQTRLTKYGALGLLPPLLGHARSYAEASFS